VGQFAEHLVGLLLRLRLRHLDPFALVVLHQHPEVAVGVDRIGGLAGGAEFVDHQLFVGEFRVRLPQPFQQHPVVRLVDLVAQRVVEALLDRG